MVDKTRKLKTPPAVQHPRAAGGVLFGVTTPLVIDLLTSLMLIWCVSVSQPPAEVCLTDLAWDYPGV